MIEMAFALVVLIPALLGVLRFGLACFHYAGLQNAVRAGARFAGNCTYNAPDSRPAPDWEQAVKNMTVYGDPGGHGLPAAPGLTPRHVTVEMVFQRSAPDTVRVSIRDYPLDLLVAKVTLNKPWSEFPYSGRWAPPRGGR